VLRHTTAVDSQFNLTLWRDQAMVFVNAYLAILAALVLLPRSYDDWVQWFIYHVRVSF
jgi:hypothetical protein